MAADPERHWLWGAALEFSVYAAIVGGFLSVYVIHFQEPIGVVKSHLTMLTTFLVWPLGLRILLWTLIGPGRSSRIAATILILAPPLLTLAWYVLVVIGLDSWGRVVTGSMILTYAAQAPYLLRALGLSPWGVLVTLLAGVLVLALVFWRWFAPWDWVRRAVSTGSKSGVTVITIGLLLMAGLVTHSLMQYQVRHPREPIALSFWPAPKELDLQSHVVAGSVVLDAQEDAERRAYVAAMGIPKRNLILIVGDALRAEHMSVYGYDRETTPWLSRVTQERSGEVVRGLRSACAESTCGLMALGASRPVAEIGSAPMTIQEVLRRNGYAVHFIQSGDHTNFYGLRSMYGELDSFRDGTSQSLRYVNDDELVLDALASLPWAEQGHPVALQLHLMSTHGLGSRVPELSPFQPWENYYRWPKASPKRAPSPEAAKAAVNYYDNGVRRLDYSVSRILGELGKKGYLDNALVVVTGDHGEMLGERGIFGHQYGVSEQVLNIPFLMLRYGYEGGRLVDRPVAGQIDIAPTVLRELEVPVPRIWKGRALQDKPVPAEYAVQQGRVFGLYHLDEKGRVLKYERSLDTNIESVIDPESDPLGTRNLLQVTSKSLLDRWRVQSASTMFNSRVESPSP